MLAAACCLLHAACCMVSVACPSHVVRRMLSVACPSNVVRRMLSIALPPVVRFMLPRAYWRGAAVGASRPSPAGRTAWASAACTTPWHVACHVVSSPLRGTDRRVGTTGCGEGRFLPLRARIVSAVCAAWAIYSCCRHPIRGAHCVPAADLLNFLSLQRHELSLSNQPSPLLHHPLPKAYALASKPEPHRANDHFKRHRRLILQCRRTFVTTVIKRSLAVPSNVKLWLCFFNAFFTLASFANSSQAIPCSAACVSGYGAMAGG